MWLKQKKLVRVGSTYSAKELWAARLLQRCYRGAKHRERFARIQELIAEIRHLKPEIDRQVEERNVAGQYLQRIFRGYIGRKRWV